MRNAFYKSTCLSAAALAGIAFFVQTPPAAAQTPPGNPGGPGGGCVGEINEWVTGQQVQATLEFISNAPPGFVTGQQVEIYAGPLSPNSVCPANIATANADSRAQYDMYRSAPFNCEMTWSPGPPGLVADSYCGGTPPGGPGATSCGDPIEFYVSSCDSSERDILATLPAGSHCWQGKIYGDVYIIPTFEWDSQTLMFVEFTNSQGQEIPTPSGVNLAGAGQDCTEDASSIISQMQAQISAHPCPAPGTYEPPMEGVGNYCNPSQWPGQY